MKPESNTNGTSALILPLFCHLSTAIFDYVIIDASASAKNRKKEECLWKSINYFQGILVLHNK